MTSEFVGVDGSRCGWVSVGFDGDGEYELKAFFTFDELVEHYQAAKLILVDMPIGLPEDEKERNCDPEARALIKPRGATVFRAPTRQAMTQLAGNPGDPERAKRVQMCVTGTSLTIQTLAIMPKINAVDLVMRSQGRRTKPEIREIHPEVCFWALNNRCPIIPKKQDPEGIKERLRVLALVEPKAKEIFDAGCRKFPGNGVADDDIVDALAAAVTAYQGRHDRLPSLPEEKERRQTDGKGLPMEMVFWEPPGQ